MLIKITNIPIIIFIGICVIIVLSLSVILDIDNRPTSINYQPIPKKYLIMFLLILVVFVIFKVAVPNMLNALEKMFALKYLIKIIQYIMDNVFPLVNGVYLLVENTVVVILVVPYIRMMVGNVNVYILTFIIVEKKAIKDV